jgi:HSP20 family protein
MDVVKNVREIGSEIEHGIETGLRKGRNVLHNVASHLPFANFARKDGYNYTVEVDLPGVNKQDIDITVDGTTLTISAVRRMNKEVNQEDYYIQESYFGKISRSFILPEYVDKDDIDARLEDGRLYIGLKKKTATQPGKIIIK